MSRKWVIGLVSTALSLSGVTGVTGSYCGWFGGADKPAMTSSAHDKDEVDAAARHCRCQPRHWRYLMLQTQH